MSVYIYKIPLNLNMFLYNLLLKIVCKHANMQFIQGKTHTDDDD